MKALSRLSRAASNPVLFARHANRLYHRRLDRRRYNPEGIDVFAEDWDTLVILDACRYDMFERHSALPGRLEHRHTRGTDTREFLKANFAGRDLRDTVYVTANPQLHHNRGEIAPTLYNVIDIWREAGWNEEHGTVLPETVTEYAMRAAREHPKKRLVVHYIQPHYPFIDSETTFDKRHLADSDSNEGGVRGENVWGQLITGALDASPADIWRPYTANLTRALPHVEELLCELDGRTVVTADHGNMVGERSFPIPIREWGHPRGTYTEQLTKVPWLIYDNGPRRDIVAGQPEPTTADIDAETVTDRLTHLGYTE